MGKYQYTDGEKEINKVFKLNEWRNVEVKESLDSTIASADDSISSSEELLKSLGYAKELLSVKASAPLLPHAEPHEPLEVPDWEELVSEANVAIDYDAVLEDILSADEFRFAYRDLDCINEAFSRRVKLNKVDISFLMLATALQTMRRVLMPSLGETIDPNTRIDDKAGDASVKAKQKAYAEKHKDWDSSKSSQGRRSRELEGKSWQEIISSSVPYDATASSPVIGINMAGKYHRYKTLGHDPILGWLFGTANILTDTITLNNFTSYRVEKMKFTSETVLLPFVFEEAYHWVEDDIHRLPAAILKQGIHFTSDKNTKLGLPIPLLGAFSDDLAGKLYKSQYDALCLAKDAKKVGLSVGIAILINMIIGLTHKLFYTAEKDGDPNLYEVRTRKILMYSNSFASVSNVVIVCITKNPKKLDVGGLLVTISRLFTDIRFIARIKQEFIEAELDAGLQEQLDEVDRLFLEN